jgi:ubiquinol-cytochrome c reductase iron-sulfur subunit
LADTTSSHPTTHPAGVREDAPHGAEGGTRRDFLILATGAFAAVGIAAAAWPFIHQMNPDAGALALASVDVDISDIEVGQAITVLWRGSPVFIRHRTQAEVEEARVTPLEALPDRLARNANLPEDAPATDDNRAVPGREEWLIQIGICTHLGCVPLGQREGDPLGDFGGWFCPCHGSHYDTAGRIRRGPAPENLHIPEYAFIDDTTVRIG